MPPFQSSSTLHRCTVDNALIAQGVVHFMHKKKGQHGCLMFKIDFEKAYDKVDWDFLRLTLIEFGFPNLIVDLIMNCTMATSLSLSLK